VHEKRGFEQVRLVIEADPVNLLKSRLSGSQHMRVILVT
jgi:hypothetical protein